jgi:hypothetical protein
MVVARPDPVMNIRGVHDLISMTSYYIFISENSLHLLLGNP